MAIGVEKAKKIPSFYHPKSIAELVRLVPIFIEYCQYLGFLQNGNKLSILTTDI